MCISKTKRVETQEEVEIVEGQRRVCKWIVVFSLKQASAAPRARTKRGRGQPRGYLRKDGGLSFLACITDLCCGVTCRSIVFVFNCTITLLHFVLDQKLVVLPGRLPSISWDKSVFAHQLIKHTDISSKSKNSTSPEHDTTWQIVVDEGAATEAAVEVVHEEVSTHLTHTHLRTLTELP
jgi:hypothetical protein